MYKYNLIFTYVHKQSFFFICILKLTVCTENVISKEFFGIFFSCFISKTFLLWFLHNNVFFKEKLFHLPVAFLWTVCPCFYIVCIQICSTLVQVMHSVQSSSSLPAEIKMQGYILCILITLPPSFFP